MVASQPCPARQRRCAHRWWRHAHHRPRRVHDRLGIARPFAEEPALRSQLAVRLLPRRTAQRQARCAHAHPRRRARQRLQGAAEALGHGTFRTRTQPAGRRQRRGRLPGDHRQERLRRVPRRRQRALRARQRAIRAMGVDRHRRDALEERLAARPQHPWPVRPRHHGRRHHRLDDRARTDRRERLGGLGWRCRRRRKLQRRRHRVPQRRDRVERLRRALAERRTLRLLGAGGRRLRRRSGHRQDQRPLAR